jgi:Na+-transporting NADH:ubiquinone oxidoreductase subunit NqrC
MKNKALVAVLSILIILTAIMAYVLSYSKIQNNDTQKYQAEIMKIENVSNSNEIIDIENDLEETNFEDIDKELVDIEKELFSSD